MRLRSGRIVGWIPVLALVGLSLAPSADARTATSLTLDGTGQRIVVEDHPVLNPTGGITIEAWIRPTTYSNFPTIYGKRFLSAQWLGLTTGGVLRFYPRGDGSSIDGATPIPLSQWSHVAVTYDPDDGRRVYYIDGQVELDVTTGAAPIRIDAWDLGIGAEADGSFSFTGNLAEVRLWSRVRSQDEIRRDMWKQLQGDEAPELMAVWPLDGDASDARGRTPGTPVGFTLPDQAFGNFPAPPTPEDPARIPRLDGTPTIDGLCGGAEYGLAQWLPIWFDADPALGDDPVFAQVGADASWLYVCLPERPIPPSGRFEVFLDGAADGGSLPQPGDYRFRVLQNESLQAAEGSGTFLGWVTTTVPGFDGTPAVIDEFNQSYEMRIPRSLITSSDGVFGLQIADRHELVPFGPVFDFGWPDDQILDSPSSFEPAIIDDTPVMADSRDPTVFLRSLMPGDQPRLGEAITVEAVARDFLGDLQTIEIWVDGAVAVAMDFPGTADDFGTLALPPTLLPLGHHTLRARAVDHRGRVGWSRAEILRVLIDGEAPEILVSHSPREPAAGETITITAQATDASGITSIVIDYYPLGLRETCSFGGGSTTETCVASVPTTGDGRIIRYSAAATDVEGQFARTSTRMVLIGNGSGVDSDGDGIDGDLEAILCTSPYRPDSDGDSLLDGWELLGIPDASGTGIFVDLPQLGANPCFRDVFVQYDYEVGARVDAGVVEDTIGIYRRHRINLHVEENERPRLGGRTLNPDAGGAMMYQTADNGGEFWFPPERMWSHYYVFSKHWPGRSSGGDDRAFTYDIYFPKSANQGTCDGGSNVGNACLLDSDCPGSTCSGECSCPLDGSIDPSTCDGGVAGCFRESTANQKNRFIHELGHALGLGHGGRAGFRVPTRDGDYFYYPGSKDNVNQKPNYHSAMSYDARSSNLCVTPMGTILGDPGYSEQILPVLNESDLDETPTGFAMSLASIDCSHAAVGSRPVIRYSCTDPDDTGVPNDVNLRYLMVSDGTQTISRRPHNGSWDNAPPAHAPGIDFDCDGIIEASSIGNLNGDGNDWILPPEPCDGTDNNGLFGTDEGCNWSAPPEMLIGREDWSFLPSPPPCLIPYDLTGQCYLWPAVYRTAVGSHAPDCRPSPVLPTDQCPNWPPIYASGLPEDPYPDTELDLPPGTEFCDALDNDDDGEIDEGCRDSDGDGHADRVDNCPETANGDQVDSDRDGLGDACESLTPVQPGVLYTDAKGVGLQWQAANTDVLGYNVYCLHPFEESARFIGDGFPSTTATLLEFLPPWAGTYDCRIAPVDLRGEEKDANPFSFYTDFDEDGQPDPDEEPIPEPGFGLGLALGVGGLGLFRRGAQGRRRTSKRLRSQSAARRLRTQSL